jgi:hypothetical protein
MKPIETKILNTICEVFNKDPNDFYSKDNKKRSKDSVFLRQTLAYILYNYEKYTYSNLSVVCGLNNHVTSIHSRKSIENLIETDKFFEKRFKICLHKLGYSIENQIIYEEMLKLINETLTKLTELNNQIVRKLEDV